MANINIGRVVLGGLAAGVILCLGEYVLNDIVLADRMKVYYHAHNFKTPGTSAIAVAVVMTLVLGIVIVLGYAAIRSRFGPGPKTAVIAALFAWFGVYLYNFVVGNALGLLPTDFLPILLGWGIVEYILAALVGAWLYKEA
jgi:hypothetical protein